MLHDTLITETKNSESNLGQTIVIWLKFDDVLFGYFLSMGLVTS